MKITIESRRKSLERLKSKNPEAVIIDVTSKSTDNFIKLSPFYPHGDIPVPYSEGFKSQSVEGIWQGLKVFETADIDVTKFENNKMSGLKRTVKRFGKVLGHRNGVNGEELYDYIKARLNIYLPSYHWVLENKCSNLVKQLKELSNNHEVILLDYETNQDIYNPTKPLSHASVVKEFLEKKEAHSA